MTRPLPEKKYIGDGVYARFDGHQIVLETSNGVSTTNRIALEPEVLRQMDQYREYVRQHGYAGIGAGVQGSTPALEPEHRSHPGLAPLSGKRRTERERGRN